MKLRVLIIDDDEKVSYSLKRLLEEEDDFEIFTSLSGEEGIKRYKEGDIDITITDLVLGKMNGIEVLEAIKRINSDAVIIMMTGKGSETTALDAIKKGAYDYFPKPFDYTNFFKTIRNAKEKIELKKEIENKFKGSFCNIRYKSAIMKELIELIKKISKSSLNVLINGESGTGKELIAESLYAMSDRNDKPFIKINCGAIPENLMESELFGHVKGAFSGAVADKKGKLELADKGIVFLDEIGELDMKLQVKILRVLEDGIVERVGATRGQKVDVRIIAATNVNLEKAVEEKKFRLDLYYRLNVLKIDVPPLRDRPEDIVYLAKSFLAEFTKQFEMSEKEISEDVLKMFLNYKWPGNIRELKNTIQRMLVICGDEKIIGKSSVPQNVALIENRTIIKEDLSEMSYKEFMAEQEIRYFSSVYEKYGENKTEMAKKIGMSRRNLYDKLNEYKIL